MKLDESVQNFREVIESSPYIIGFVFRSMFAFSMEHSASLTSGQLTIVAEMKIKSARPLDYDSKV